MSEGNQRETQDQPVASRPHMPDYGVPETSDGMLPWSWVTERLSDALVYWVGTVRPDGRPHTTPIWGAWLDGAFYFEGGPHTRRSRNIATNQAVVVHIERGDEVVIIEGTAEVCPTPDADLTARLIGGYAKYVASHDYHADPDNWKDGGLHVVRPDKVLAWSQFPTDATRFLFRR